MFIGHFALRLAAKRATPSVSLALLFTAAQLADMLWPVFLAAGIEQVRIDPGNTAVTPLAFVSYPYSHPLILLLGWGLAMALNSVTATAAVEVPMFLAGIWIYARSTRARDGVGRWAFRSLMLTLLLIYVANIFGPPPPSVRALVMTMAVGIPLFTFWSWWVDRHRDPVAVS